MAVARTQTASGPELENNAFISRPWANSFHSPHPLWSVAQDLSSGSTAMILIQVAVIATHQVIRLLLGRISVSFCHKPPARRRATGDVQELHCLLFLHSRGSLVFEASRTNANRANRT